MILYLAALSVLVWRIVTAIRAERREARRAERVIDRSPLDDSLVKE